MPSEANCLLDGPAQAQRSTHCYRYAATFSGPLWTANCLHIITRERKRESERENARKGGCERERVRKRESVCEREKEKTRERVCVSEKERKGAKEREKERRRERENRKREIA